MGKKTDLESVHLVNHSKCMLAAFQNFRQDETMLDATLVCDGSSLKAHKLVLSACSPLFKEMFSENPCSHPIIILRHFDFCDLKAVIDFVYKGELSVPRERLMSSLKVAEDLQIRGLRRSEPNREKYEKLYNQVCGKFSARKKRKRHRANSSDSDNEVVLSASDSCVESDESRNAKDKVTSELQPMETEADFNENSTSEVRPVVLHVGDSFSSNEESNSKNVFADDESNVMSSAGPDLSASELQKEMNVPSEEMVEDQVSEYVPENIASSSQVDSFADCSDNANSQLEFVHETEENSFEEGGIEASNDIAEEQDNNSASFSSMSPKPETTQSDETKLPDEGKRFICSKCDSVFTSRISFMKHKATGHSAEQEVLQIYKCQECSYTNVDFDSVKAHLMTHLDKVPFKCETCAEEFDSEELYKLHASVHESEQISLHDITTTSVEDLYPPQDTSVERPVEFRCSVCFGKFTSKLRCQIHEKTCDGGS